MKIVLGSASQGRRRIFAEMFSEFEVVPAAINEKLIRRRDPREMVLALALAKADAVRARVRSEALIITADQVVLWCGTVREKPSDEHEARMYLETVHLYPSETLNGIAVTNTKTGRQVAGIESSKIYFRQIPRAVIEKLIEERRVYEYAGGFSTEEPEVAPYVMRLEGSADSVIGLPKRFLSMLLAEVAGE